MPDQPYQLVSVVPGQWYVSDTGKSGRKNDSTIIVDHKYGRNNMRVGGPCDSKEAAEVVREELIAADSGLKGGRLYVWQAATEPATS
jgi:hypothetical protein